jgi:Family of unknown function (DUF6101)
MRSGGLPAGSSRALRLDPFALPARYAAADAGADGHKRDVELHRERVVVRRAVGGMQMSLNMPVSNFLGVAMRVLPPSGDAQAAVALVLEHADPSLALPLFVSCDSTDLTEQWQSWSSVLGVPQIVDDLEGGWRQPFADNETLATAEPCSRRRRRSAMKRRRSSFLMRRGTGRLGAVIAVHNGEREIIARN